MNLHKPVRIGSFTTRGNLFLAPVAGYSDAAYRSICLEQGCDLAYTEMVSSEALTRDSARTMTLMERGQGEDDYAVQLFGGNPEVMARAAELCAASARPSLIDVNCGCPVPKIVRSGAGSALMRDPDRVRLIVKAMTDASDTPVSVKIRLGWDESSLNYLDVAKAAVDGGAAAVTLHARTRVQGYSGKADRGAFGILARALPVPVFASGDLFSPQDALDILADGAVAGVMFARGAMGDPFIFRRAKALLSGQPDQMPSMAERIAAARKHFILSLGVYGERLACVEFRKQACSWLKGIQHGAELRAKAVNCSTAADYERFFLDWESLAGL